MPLASTLAYVDDTGAGGVGGGELAQAALPLSPELGLDTTGVHGPVLDDSGLGACLDHVVDGAAWLDTSSRRWWARRPDLASPVLDLLVAVAALGLAVMVPGSLAVPTAAAAAMPVAWPAALWASGGYGGQRLGLTRVERRQRVLRAGSLLALASFLIASLTTLPLASAQVIALLAGVTSASLLLSLGTEGRLSRGAGRPRVVVAGRGDDVTRVVSELRRAPGHRLEIAGVCLYEMHASGRSFDVPVAFGLDRVAASVREVHAQAVIVMPDPEIAPAALRRVSWELEQVGADLCVGTPLLDVAASRTRVTEAGGLRMVHVRSAALRGPGRVLKDVVERAIAALVLLALLPVLLLLALAIRQDSPGPAIFRQSRVGRGGRQFTMYKFRTMVTDAEQRRDALLALNEAGGVLFKLRHDPRVSRLGRVLRRYSLDEIPQLVNVVLGQMSLVGPRPALPSEVARYEEDPRRRLVVKPGITGLWQVSGRADLSWEDTVRLDLAYVDNWCLGLDASILRRTVGAVISSRGAY